MYAGGIKMHKSVDGLLLNCRIWRSRCKKYKLCRVWKNSWMKDTLPTIHIELLGRMGSSLPFKLKSRPYTSCEIVLKDRKIGTPTIRRFALRNIRRNNVSNHLRQIHNPLHFPLINIFPIRRNIAIQSSNPLATSCSSCFLLWAPYNFLPDTFYWFFSFVVKMPFLYLQKYAGRIKSPRVLQPFSVALLSFSTSASLLLPISSSSFTVPKG